MQPRSVLTLTGMLVVSWLLAVPVLAAHASPAGAESSGALDQTFGSGGRVFTDFNAGSGARAIVIHSDGRILAAGTKVG